jgi:glutamate synthase (ferredoxin)
VVVVLGRTGRNFAAGMSGGIAYVLDEQGDFAEYRCNMEMVGLEKLEDAREIQHIRHMIENHLKYTDSAVARRVLAQWDELLPKFVKVMPTDYKKALEKIAKEKQAEILEGESAGELEMAGTK